MLTALKTDTGKIRQHNEDDAGIFKGKDEFILAVVADGMGGHLAKSNMNMRLIMQQ